MFFMCFFIYLFHFRDSLIVLKIYIIAIIIAVVIALRHGDLINKAVTSRVV